MAKRDISPFDSDELRRDPVAFTRALLKNPDGSPATPHPGQEQVLRGIRRYTTIAAGRQFGKSLLLGWLICWYLCTHKHKTVLLVAPALDQTRIIFNEVARQFRSAPLKYLLVKKIKEYPFPEIELVTGMRLICRGANSPQFIRGHSPHFTVIDEAAFIKAGVIGATISPAMNVSGQGEDSALIQISTPFGMGEFQEHYAWGKEDTTGRYASFHFTSYDNPYADKTDLDGKKAYYGETSFVWLTEYLAEFIDDALSVFPWTDIKAAMDLWPYADPETGKPIFPVRPLLGHRYVQGVDLANLNDYFVSTVLDITDPNLVPLIHMDRLQKQGYGHYKSIIRGNWHAYHKPRTLIDATTLAESFVEELRDIDAEGYKFTGSQAKYDAVQELARMLSEHRLALPPGRSDITDELRYFQYSITPSKALKMEAKHGHDDVVMSLALSAILAARPTMCGFFQGVNLIRHNQAPLTIPKHIDPWAELARFEE